jgi:poly(ribitol-phosphate) beta-N-acetylglucosaminyltransferase
MRSQPGPGTILVSVVVPVYNPGAAIGRCIDSLLAQTMDPACFEVVFVDDGSTDTSPARLDAVAAEHANVRVIHEPNSGWSGKPRNTGIDAARGEYVLFVDHDDRLGTEALERLHAFAVRNEADVVLPKVIGLGRDGSAFGSIVLDQVPPGNSVIFTSLTPHKLFRTAFLREHGIRFPEGRRRLEDHAFVLQAYFAARVISICADYPAYYHYAIGGQGSAASGRYDPTGGFDPAYYYRYVREALDIVATQSQPGPLRDGAHRRYMTRELLGRLDAAHLQRWTPSQRDAVVSEVADILRRYMPPAIDSSLPPYTRVQACLVRTGRTDLLEPLAAAERRLRARVVANAVSADPDGTLRIAGFAEIVDRGRPVRLERHGDAFLLPIPPSVAAAVPDDLRVLNGSVLTLVIRLLRRNPADEVQVRATLAPATGTHAGEARVDFTAAIDRAAIADAGGSSDTAWEAVGRVGLGRIHREAAIVRSTAAGRVRLLAFAGGQEVPGPGRWHPDGVVARASAWARRAGRSVRRRLYRRG